MLDSKARYLIEPMFKRSASFLLGLGFSPNGITALAFIFGAASAIALLVGEKVVALVLLWVSGWLDAVDGTAARMTGQKNPWGTFIDITSDRLVEVLIILVFSIIYPEMTFEFVLLLSAILMSMTVFLTSAALIDNKGIKSFHYQKGIMERTEGFLFFTLMILFPLYMGIITKVFAIMIMLTFIQRVAETYKRFHKKG
jgi:CDP-diacylglycerol--glycerol-3-phosphate 3-phosphatidyltransferase